MSMIKVMICGEGPSDVGKTDYESQKWIPGPAVAFVEKAFAHDTTIIAISRQDLLHNHKHRLGRIRSKKGHAVKAERLAKLARRQNCNIAICYIDCDRNEFDSLYNDVVLGFDRSETKIVGIPMLPKPMIEAWLMGDKNAYLQVLGKIPSKPSLPRKPEELRGDKSNPSSNYAKNVLSRVISQFSIKDDHWRYEIAIQSDPDTMSRICPISYGRFLNDALTSLSLVL